MFTRILVSVTLMILVEVPPASSKRLVSFDGVGPVSVGMSVGAIERALGAKLDPQDKLVFLADCNITERSDKVDPGIQYTFRDGRLTRIDIWQPNDVTVPSDPATAEGIWINSAEADVKRIYGTEFVITLAPTFSENDTPPEYWLHLDRPKDGRGIIFNTREGQVTAILVGLHDDISEMEMCR